MTSARPPKPAELVTLIASKAAARRIFPVGTEVGDQYIIRDLAGQGGMGIVFLVWDRNLERECALKMLLPHQHPRYAPKQYDAARMLTEEAKVHAKLGAHSPEHFLQVFRQGTFPFLVDEGGVVPREIALPYYAMEALKGHDLFRIVHHFKRHGRIIPIADVLHLSLQCASSLAIAHALGLVHRDVKPGNFFMTNPPTGSPVIKLLDFGISKKAGETSKSPTGTWRYIAPELLKSEERIESTKSDVYPLGISLFELCALRGPFDEEERSVQTSGYWTHAHLYETPALLSAYRPDAPRGLVEIVAASLEKETQNRPTAAEVSSALARLLTERVEKTSNAESFTSLLQKMHADEGPALAMRSASAALARTVPPQHSSGGTRPSSVVSEVYIEDKDGEDEADDRTVPPTLDVTAPAGSRTLDGLGEPTPPLRIIHSTAEIFESIEMEETRYVSSPILHVEAPASRPATHEIVSNVLRAAAKDEADAEAEERAASLARRAVSTTSPVTPPPHVPSNRSRVAAVRRTQRRALALQFLGAGGVTIAVLLYGGRLHLRGAQPQVVSEARSEAPPFASTASPSTLPAPATSAPVGPATNEREADAGPAEAEASSKPGPARRPKPKPRGKDDIPTSFEGESDLVTKLTSTPTPSPSSSAPRTDAGSERANAPRRPGPGFDSFALSNTPDAGSARATASRRPKQGSGSIDVWKRDFLDTDGGVDQLEPF